MCSCKCMRFVEIWMSPLDREFSSTLGSVKKWPSLMWQNRFVRASSSTRDYWDLNSKCNYLVLDKISVIWYSTCPGWHSFYFSTRPTSSTAPQDMPNLPVHLICLFPSVVNRLRNCIHLGCELSTTVGTVPTSRAVPRWKPDGWMAGLLVHQVAEILIESNTA